MSHKQNDRFAELFNEFRKENGLSEMSISEAINEVYDGDFYSNGIGRMQSRYPISSNFPLGQEDIDNI